MFWNVIGSQQILTLEKKTLRNPIDPTNKMKEKSTKQSNNIITQQWWELKGNSKNKSSYFQLNQSPALLCEFKTSSLTMRKHSTMSYPNFCTFVRALAIPFYAMRSLCGSSIRMVKWNRKISTAGLVNACHWHRLSSVCVSFIEECGRSKYAWYKCCFSVSILICVPFVYALNVVLFGLWIARYLSMHYNVWCSYFIHIHNAQTFICVVYS